LDQEKGKCGHLSGQGETCDIIPMKYQFCSGKEAQQKNMCVCVCSCGL